jgi:NADPH:quinone reductase-like Zn-dependent oxidoreductase
VPAVKGAQIMAEVVDLVTAQKIRPVVGAVVDFDEIPGAMEAMANRQTVGRTIVRLW